MPTRVEFQQLVTDRLLDAEALLASPTPRSSAAYYLIGYAVECGLKACILRRLSVHPESVYEERKFLNDYWTHDPERLLKAANLERERDNELRRSAAFGIHWQRVKDWTEDSRYQQKTVAQARGLYEAVTHPTEGVLQWIKQHW